MTLSQRLITYLLLVFTGFIVLYPVSFLILIALNIGDPFEWPPSRLGLNNFAAILDYLGIVFNTLRVCVMATVLALVAEQLFEIDKNVNTVGRVVEKSENPEPNIYVWTLRRGVKFQDGSDLTAEAVKFNLERHITDPKSVRNQDVKDITSVETPDQYTVRVTLKGPFAPFLNKVAGPSSAGTLLSPAAVQRLGENLQRDLTNAGAGAFKFREWQRDTQIAVERNETYWKKDASGGPTWTGSSSRSSPTRTCALPTSRPATRTCSRPTRRRRMWPT
ncbi:MAG: hypothetical protein C4345_08565 [Chloroflexota bacterium]